MCAAGDSLHIWDPVGRHLQYSAGKAQAAGCAKSYRHVGSSLPGRFADQFAPWAFAGDSVHHDANATLMRLALRSTEGVEHGVAQVSS